MDHWIRNYNFFRLHKLGRIQMKEVVETRKIKNIFLKLPVLSICITANWLARNYKRHVELTQLSMFRLNTIKYDMCFCGLLFLQNWCQYVLIITQYVYYFNKACLLRTVSGVEFNFYYLSVGRNCSSLLKQNHEHRGEDGGSLSKEEDKYFRGKLSGIEM